MSLNNEPAVTLVNYGLGNIQAFSNIYKRSNISVNIAREPADLLRARRLILPGVGSFDWAMTRLNASGLRGALDEAVLQRRVPILGVCVGMQMMAHRSEEGVLAGLGWIDAEVIRFDDRLFGGRTHLPHMGWNDTAPTGGCTLFKGIAAPRYYFLHSYYMVPKRHSDILSTTHYGCEFAAAVQVDNIFGTQFHPEKSHRWGVELLNNFSGI